ncbi:MULTISPECIES: glycosyltransferase family 2 protein [Chitinophagaceae]|uniref:glycosyltransferase family 2 protein n=1 Tax=Chitinophagaceae TaxID=563835 RepID=UPI000F5099F7|nr:MULTISPECIES: glycosyltransferase family A protein [Chitinophagaceae]RPD51597.1 glycosyltransferase [Paracnuella aquatica]
MERIPSTPPSIDPVAPGVHRPKISVMVPVFNCTEYIQEALESVLQQGWSAEDMQIEVIDDFSTDADVEGLVQRVGGGRVAYYRQQANVGSLWNFQTCIQRARGHYVHILHGDDKVHPGFYDTMMGIFETYPEAGAAFCAFDMMGPTSEFFATSGKMEPERGIIKNALYRMGSKPWLQYACMVVKREAYEQLGSFYLATYGEDWEMWVRIAKNYPIVYTPEALAVYRVHPSSITRRSYMTGENIRDLAKVIKRIAEHLPKEQQKQAATEARKYWAYTSLNICYSLWYRTHDKNVVMTQMNEALKLYRDPFLTCKSYFIRMIMMMPKTWLPAMRGAYRKVWFGE